jgi:hypothetical protein
MNRAAMAEMTHFQPLLKSGKTGDRYCVEQNFPQLQKRPPILSRVPAAEDESKRFGVGPARSPMVAAYPHSFHRFCRSAI